MGGTNWLPVEAKASMAPAEEGRYPPFIIMGMVNVPEVVTLAVALR